MATARPVRVVLVAAALAAIFGAVFAVYWPYLNDFFALDDYIWLKEASNPSAADYFRRAFSFPRASYFDPQTPFWRPLIDTYFFCAWRVFGQHPVPYHVVNVVLHGAVATLLAVLAWQLSSSKLSGFLAGLLFAVLPTYDVAVTWISSATELFGTFFYVLAVVLFAAYLRGAGPRRWLYGGALAATLFALLSKESTVTLPAALAGVAMVTKLPRTRGELRAIVIELAPFVVLTIAYFALLYVEEYRPSTGGGAYQFGWHARTSLWDYLKWLALPVRDTRAGWIKDARPYAASTFLALGAASVAFRRWPAAFAFGWTFFALLPYCFFRGGIEYRYSYLACVPFVIFLVLLAREAGARLRLRAPTPVVMCAATALVFVVSGFLAREARDAQATLSFQGGAYRQVYVEVPKLCGALPPESRIFLVYDPVYDLFDTSVRMALNLTYEDVSVYRSAPDPLVAFVPNVCVVDYVNGRFVLVDRH